jgi:hypothetical protein
MEIDEPVLTLEQALAAFATAERTLPIGAMLWCRDNWETAAPDLLQVVARFADGTDRSEDAANATLFILHMAAERRDPRALAPLCRLARDNDALEAVIGFDGSTESLPSLLISVSGGDPGPIKTLIEAPEADEYARGAALHALGYLAADGRLPLADTIDYLLRLLDVLQPRALSFVWFAWAETIVSLRVDGAMERVVRLYADGFIDATLCPQSDFREIDDDARAAPTLVAAFEPHLIGFIDDAIAELSQWSSFRDDDDFHGDGIEDEDLENWAMAQEQGVPAINPHKDIGRNDPCPCGSGKKFKKCCLGLTAA